MLLFFKEGNVVYSYFYYTLLFNKELKLLLFILPFAPKFTRKTFLRVSFLGDKFLDFYDIANDNA